MKTEFNQGRRAFLRKALQSATAVTVLFNAGCAMPVLPTTSDEPEQDVNSWIQLSSTGRVRLFIGKAEMGQGVTTSLTQLVAEELGVDVDAIEVLLPTTDDIPPVRMTVGSESINTLYIPVRRAASRLRLALLEQTSERTGVGIDGLEITGDGVLLVSENRFFPFSEIIISPSTYQVSTADLKMPQEFNVVGKPIPRVDLQEKLVADVQYSHDIRFEGMVYGAVLSPPTFGSVLSRVNVERAKKLEGVLGVVVELDNSFVGVVANTQQKARTALRAIEAEWTASHHWQMEDIEQRLDVNTLFKTKRGHHLRHEGRIDVENENPELTVDLHFWTPFGAHAALETHAAVADIGSQKADIWASTQDAFYHRSLVADVTGMDISQVTVHNTMIGGAFGGKVRVDAVIDAAVLSKAVGLPVKVIWDRKDCFTRGYFRSPSSHHIKAGIGSDGKIAFWQHHFASGPIIYSPSFINGIVKWATDFMVDDGGARGSQHAYNIPNQDIRYWDEELPVPTGAWRGLGASANAFAVEAIIDELSFIAKADPVDFRLSHLDDKSGRLVRVLKTAAEKSGWFDSPEGDVVRGIACSVYKDETYVAVVAEVRKGEKGNFTLKKLTCVHDCGILVNPDQVKAQIEGNLVWGIGSALKEELTLEAGKFRESTFNDYGIVRINECPEMNIHLIDDGKSHPTGAGEAALMPTPAAIANAYSRALNRRLTSLPLKV